MFKVVLWVGLVLFESSIETFSGSGLGYTEKLSRSVHKQCSQTSLCQRLSRHSQLDQPTWICYSCSSVRDKKKKWMMPVLIQIELTFQFGSVYNRTRFKNEVKSYCKSQKNLKVVKWGWKLWNGHILVYIYHKQCGIKQKNQWKSSNGQLQCFSKGTSAT